MATFLVQFARHGEVAGVEWRELVTWTDKACVCIFNFLFFIFALRASDNYKTGGLPQRLGHVISTLLGCEYGYLVTFLLVSFLVLQFNFVYRKKRIGKARRVIGQGT